MILLAEAMIADPVSQSIVCDTHAQSPDIHFCCMDLHIANQSSQLLRVILLQDETESCHYCAMLALLLLFYFALVKLYTYLTLVFLACLSQPLCSS